LYNLSFDGSENAMLPQIRTISFSHFRASAAAEVDFLNMHNSHLWLTRHGKPVCSVISMRSESILAKVHGRDLNELAKRFEVDQARMQSAADLLKEYGSRELIGQEWSYPVFG
jgi:hypothetical protein